MSSSVILLSSRRTSGSNRLSSPLGYAITITRGEMSERLKEHDWKSCVLAQTGTEGSNPSLSARKKVTSVECLVFSVKKSGSSFLSLATVHWPLVTAVKKAGPCAT
jgi:hypothetical protein